jgi:hypothetical protein
MIQKLLTQSKKDDSEDESGSDESETSKVSKAPGRKSGKKTIPSEGEDDEQVESDVSGKGSGSDKSD